MADTIIDIYYTQDGAGGADGRHNFTNPAHPRKHNGHFTPTPVGTHYEAKHGIDHKKVKAKVLQARKRAALSRRKKSVKRIPEDKS